MLWSTSAASWPRVWYEHVIIQLTQSVSASQHQAWPQRCDCLESARTRYGCSDSPPDLEWARM
ncbi:hypothetical protein LEMLEM_LOCUS10684 [Lemmus lemmus]